MTKRQHVWPNVAWKRGASRGVLAAIGAATLIFGGCSSDVEGTTGPTELVDEFGRALVDGEIGPDGEVLDGDSDTESGDVVNDDGTSSASTQPPPTTDPPSTSLLAEQADVDPDAEGEQAEPGSGTPDFQEELDAISYDGPCELYSASELGTAISAWSQEVDLFDELPSGLGADTSVEFTEVSSSDASCEWFSDSHIWFVGVSWDVADPTFVETIRQRFDDDLESLQFEDGAVLGFVTDDSTAQLLVGGLIVRIDNLVPGNSSIAVDIDVTESLARDIARLLA